MKSEERMREIEKDSRNTRKGQIKRKKKDIRKNEPRRNVNQGWKGS